MTFHLEWLQAISVGLLLAGMVVGTWEFGEFLSPWLGRWGPGLAAILAPWGLSIAGFSNIEVPWTIYAVGVTAVWLWEPRDIAVEATLSFAMAWEVERSLFVANRDVPMLVGGLSLISLALLGYLLRKWLRRAPILFLVFMYSVSLGYIIMFRLLYGDQNMASDLIRSTVLGVFIGIYSLFRQHRHQVQETMKFEATRDALTGAYTRYGLNYWLTQQSAVSAAVFVIDLDNFKPFNDIWGHMVGDLVLQTVTKRIEYACRDEDAIVRPGGDEFAVWVPGVSTAEARKAAFRIHEAVTSKTIDLPQGSWPIEISLGWATGPLTTETAEAADQALLAAKRLGKNRIIGSGEEFDVENRTNASMNWWMTEVVQRVFYPRPTATVLTDAHGREVQHNRAYKQMAEYLDVSAARPARFLTEEDMAEAWATARKQKAAAKLLYKERADGSRWWAIQHTYPISSDTDDIAGYCAQITPLLDDSVPIYDHVKGLDIISVYPVFQPIVELSSGRLVGFEALSRPRVKNGPLPPDDLFDLAAEINQVSYVDQMCLQALLDQLNNEEQWPKNARLFVNVRAETLVDNSILTTISEKFASIVGSEKLVWELSEQSSMGSRLHDARSTLREMSATFAIDDWGAGWHPLPSFKHVNPEWIKLDRSWVQSALQDDAMLRLLKAFVAWAEEEGIYTVAEGIETEAEAKMVTDWGVYAGQGYYWGVPDRLSKFNLDADAVLI